MTRSPIAFSLVAAITTLLAACAAFEERPPPPPRPPPKPAPATPNTANPSPPANVNLSGYPLAFRQGYADGCASAQKGAEQKDAARFGTDGQYRTGWQDGFSICRRGR